MTSSSFVPKPSPAPLAVATILFVTLIAYSRLCASDFSWWDDQITIHHNAYFNPPTLQTLRHYWTVAEYGLYAPITNTVWAALAKLAYVGTPDDFGVHLNPAVFHTANVLVHLISSVLVFKLLRLLVADGFPALAGTLLFTLHPVQVETVGWISGMKDLLCWCFALCALLFFARRMQHLAGEPGALDRSAWRSRDLPIAFVFSALAMLSKPTAMILPAAMWTIDWLLIRRRPLRSAIELLPFIVLSGVIAWSARGFQTVGYIDAAPLLMRPFIAGDTFAFYIRKLMWPATLTLDYGRKPVVAMAGPLFYVWWVLPTMVGLIVVIAARRGVRLPLVAAILAALSVAPVSGLATFEMQSYSTVTDHYLYFAMIGPAMVLTWCLARWPARQWRGLAIVVVVALGVRTFLQTAYWHDSFALFAHTTLANPKSALGRNNMATVYLNRVPSRPDEAEPYIDEAYAIDSHDFFVLGTYAATKFRLGKVHEAIVAWDQALAVLKKSPEAKQIRASFAAEVAVSFVIMDDFDHAKKWADEAADADALEPHAANAISVVVKALATRAATRSATQSSSTRATTTSPSLPPASMPAR